jgi:hypothetical protein
LCDCEIIYKEFRTGLSFKDIRKDLKVEQERKYRDYNEYMFVTRHTVLGRWREIKLKMFSQFQKDLEKYGCTCKNR